MNHKTTCSVIGGDSRFYYAALRLAAHGCDVRLAGMELMEADAAASILTDFSTAFQADLLIFGLPFSNNGEYLNAPFSKTRIPVKTVINHLHQGHTVYAGMLSDAVAASLRETGASVIDYFKDEPLTLYNAMLTSEAVTGILIQKLPCSIFGADIAVTGYGRIGFYLARCLKALGANVTVFARDPLQRAKANTIGFTAKPLIKLLEEKNSFRALVNTVPHQIIGSTVFDHLNHNCLLIETASAPYGINADEAADRNMNYFLAAGLPGKYAPESAGRFIADTVLQNEREVKKNDAS